MYESITFDEVIRQELAVMDITAVALAKENNIPIIVFSQHAENSLELTVCGQGKYTIIK